MSATDKFLEQLEKGQVDTTQPQQFSKPSATDRYLDSLNLPKFEVPSKSEVSQSRAEIRPPSGDFFSERDLANIDNIYQNAPEFPVTPRSIAESGIDAGKKLLKGPVVAAETAAAMGTGGLAWLGGAAGAAREASGGLLRAREGEYARVPDESPEALARTEEYKAKAVEQNLEHPAMQGLPYGLRRSIMGQLAQGPTKAVTPQEMETRRQDLRDTVQQMFTYAPQTEGAQQATEVVVYPFELLHEGSKIVSKKFLNAMGVEGDPVAESLLTDALEIVAGAGIFAGAHGANRARIARRYKNVPKKVQKYLDTLDEFGEPKSALRRAAKDVRNWIKEQTQRHKDGEPLSQATVDKLMDLHGRYLRNRKDAPVEVGEPAARGAKTSEQLNQEFLDTLDEFGELVEDPDYQRMIASIEESRGTRSVPKRAEGEPLDTPYTPDEVEPQTLPKAVEPNIVETPPEPRPPDAPRQGLKEFWEAEGKDFPEFKKPIHLFNWYNKWQKMIGLKPAKNFADVRGARTAAQAYRNRVRIFDDVNKMRGELGLRKLRRPAQITEGIRREHALWRRERREAGITNAPIVRQTAEPTGSHNTVPTPEEIKHANEGQLINNPEGKVLETGAVQSTMGTDIPYRIVENAHGEIIAQYQVSNGAWREMPDNPSVFPDNSKYYALTSDGYVERNGKRYYYVDHLAEDGDFSVVRAFAETIAKVDEMLGIESPGQTRVVRDFMRHSDNGFVVHSRGRAGYNNFEINIGNWAQGRTPVKTLLHETGHYIAQRLPEFSDDAFIARVKETPEYMEFSERLQVQSRGYHKSQFMSEFFADASAEWLRRRKPVSDILRPVMHKFIKAFKAAVNTLNLKLRGEAAGFLTDTDLRDTAVADLLDSYAKQVRKQRETKSNRAQGDKLETVRDTGPTPEEATGGRGVQEATPVSDTSDALQPVKGGKVIRRRKGVETVVRDDGPPPEATQVDEPPAPRKTNTPSVYEDADGNIIDRRSKAQRDADADRMMQDDVTYRRARRRQNDADIEGRERLRPMEQRAAERGYLQRVRDLWLAGRERSEIGETIGREFPEVAQEAKDFNRSVAEHIDLDEMFNTAQYKKRKRAPESVRQESSGSTAVDDLLARLKPRDKKAGPNTPRAIVVIDPMLFRELWKGAKQSNVSLDTFLKNSGVDDPAERKYLVKMARQVRRDVEGLIDVSENLDSIPGQTGEIVNAKEVARRQKAGVESPIVYQGTFNMLQKAVNRAMDKSGAVGVAEGFFEGLTTGKRVVQKVLGQAGLEIFWHPIHNAMASVTRELKASTKLMRATAKAYNIGKESSRKLAIFSVAERPGGLDRLKVMKVEPVTWDQLSQTEQAFYTATRKRFDDLLERVNWAREKAGLEGLPKDKNYFPFLALAHRVKDPDVLLHQDLMSEFRQASMKPDSHKPSFTFDKGEVGGPVELDFFDVYNRYVHDALWHINMTPLMGVFERLLNQSIDVKLLTDWKGNKTRKKTMPDGTKKELPVTWQLKQSRGGRIKKTMSTYLKRVYGRYTQNVVGADKKAARIMENVAYEMSKNTAGYLVSSVSTVINQIPSVVNTIRETNVGPVARAVPMLANRSAWQKAVNESQALYNRVGAFDAHLVDNRRAAGTTKTQQRLASAYNTAQRGGEILSWPIRAAMEAVDSANVMLAYQAGKKLAKDWGLEGQEAIRFAEQVMIDSQGSGTIADVSSIQSGKLTKALTTLQTMVISQFNQLTEGMLKHSEYGSLREKAPKGYQSFQQSFTMKNLRYLAAATVAGYIFEERLNMYSVMPNPLMAAKRVVDRGGDAKDMVEELFAEGVEAVPIAGSLKFDTYSMFGAAVPQVAGAVNSVGMVWDLWDAWMGAGYDPATAMVKAVGMSIMEKPGGEVRGEAYFALAGIPVKQYIRVARQYYRGSEEDWQKLIKGYRFDELEARRAQRR